MSTSAHAPLTSGLYALKPWYTRRLGGVVGWAVSRRISPDVFTAAGIAAACGAGVALVAASSWHPVGYAVPLLLAARLAGANLDGAVARARGVSRPVGAVLNEVGDRVCDVVVLAAVALVAPPSLALLALAAAMLPTFASLSVAAAGGLRANGGPFGKTERCAALSIGALWPGAWPVLLVVVIIGSLATAGSRLVRGCRELSDAR